MYVFIPLCSPSVRQAAGGIKKGRRTDNPSGAELIETLLLLLLLQLIYFFYGKFFYEKEERVYSVFIRSVYIAAEEETSNLMPRLRSRLRVAGRGL